MFYIIIWCEYFTKNNITLPSTGIFNHILWRTTDICLWTNKLTLYLIKWTRTHNLQTLAIFLQRKVKKGPFPFFSPPPHQLLAFFIKLHIVQKSSTDIIAFDFTTILRDTFYKWRNWQLEILVDYAQGHSARILLGFEPKFSDSDSKYSHYIMPSSFVFVKREILPIVLIHIFTLMSSLIILTLLSSIRKILNFGVIWFLIRLVSKFL